MPRRNLLVLFAVAALSWLCYQRAARNRYANSLTEAMNIVATHYINEVEPRVLYEGAVKGMIGQLDPYSAYTGPEDYQQFQQQLEGEFTGVGIVVEHDTQHARLSIVEALIGKPAYLAGIRGGDAIVAVEGIETSQIPLAEAVKMIRGKAGTVVKLRVLPAGRDEPAEFELTRAAIPLETVLGDARDTNGHWVYRLASHPRIGYIRIFDNFGERTADEFRAALATYRQPGQAIDGLVLDLRYNRGGLLEAAKEVCDMLLDDGVIVTTRGRHGTLVKQHSATPGTELPPDIPLVVLVDRLSASASEIVAAALHDNGRAAVAGQRSWGKGTVQNVIKLEGGRSALRLTIGSYHRPNGEEIHKWKGAADSDDWGVRPDPGLEVLLTNAQNDLIIQSRRRRDFLSWDELVDEARHMPPGKTSPRRAAAENADATAASPPIPEPDRDPASSDGGSSAPDGEATKAARKSPTAIDGQLRQAVEHLQGEISGRRAEPPRTGSPHASPVAEEPPSRPQKLPSD